MPRRPFGACLTKTLFDANNQGIIRVLDVVELWSGVGSIASAAQKAGYKAATVDLKNGEDLTTREGFEDAVSKVLRLKPGGLLSMGIECRSFVFLNSSNCKRNYYNQYAGDTKYEPVKTATRPAANTKRMEWMKNASSRSWLKDVSANSIVCQLLKLQRSLLGARLFT